MVNSKGYRRGTRHMFARPFRKQGTFTMRPYLRVYRVGDLVDIKGNGAVQKGMPHKVFHGKTGRVFNVTRRGLGITVNKRVQGRIIPKRVCVRVDHVKPNYSFINHKRRIQKNSVMKARASKYGLRISTKREPPLPRNGHMVSTKNNKPEMVYPIQYEFIA